MIILTKGEIPSSEQRYMVEAQRGVYGDNNRAQFATMA